MGALSQLTGASPTKGRMTGGAQHVVLLATHSSTVPTLRVTTGADSTRASRACSDCGLPAGHVLAALATEIPDIGSRRVRARYQSAITSER